MPKYRIMSLDGGGIRGVITTVLLERLQAEVPALLGTTDLLTGTSTGGIIALALSKGISLTDISQLFIDEGQRIFKDSVWDNIVDLGKVRGADYDSANLRAILKRELGLNTTLADLDKRVLIPTFDLDNADNDPTKRQWKPKIFHNFPGEDTDGEVLAWKVGLYTSAAPTYFPSVDGFIDGGVYANNPSMTALSQTQDVRTHPDGQALDSIRLLSLGTGLSLTHIDGEENDWGYMQWAKPLITLMMDGTMGIADYQCKRLLGANYHRLAPTFPPGTDYPLDDVEHIAEMVIFARSVDLSQTVAWLENQW